MKTLIYIGNKFGVRKGANVSSIDTLGRLFVESGFKVYSASAKKNILLRLIDMLWTCFKYRKQADYVLIDTYSTRNFYYAYFVSVLCKRFKMKYIPILHGGKLPERLKTSPQFSKRIFQNAYLNIAPSLFTKSKFEALGFSNITCIPNTIELKNYLFKNRGFEDVRLLWVRSFSEIYNPLLAVKILKALKDEGIKAELCMVGPDSDGSLERAKKLANQLDVKVDFTGKLTKEAWIKRSENYNIFINTTNFDNMPISVIEAMALGLPVISTDVGGMPFLIQNKKNGILVKPESVDAFVESIKHMVSNKDVTNEIIKEARAYTERLDWEIIKNHWINVLE